MGAFTFAALPDIAAFGFLKGNPITDGAVTRANAAYTIDCLAGLAGIRDISSLHSRKPTQIITLFGIFCAGIVGVFSALKIAKPNKTINAKNIPLFKLRI
jgi:hypothetical protein